MVEWQHEIGSIVQYKWGSDRNHWAGVVVARETYEDFCPGVHLYYHVRWINPDGSPESSVARIHEKEVETRG